MEEYNYIKQFENASRSELEMLNHFNSFFDSQCNPEFKIRYEQNLAFENIDLASGISNINPQEPEKLGITQLTFISENLDEIKQCLQPIVKSIEVKVIEIGNLDKTDFFGTNIISTLEMMEICSNSYEVQKYQSQGYYKSKISQTVQKLSKEPYFSSILIYNEQSNLFNFVKQLTFFFVLSKKDYVKEDCLRDDIKSFNTLLSSYENLKEIKFEDYRQCKDQIMQSIRYYEIVTCLKLISDLLQYFQLRTKSLEDFLIKEGLLNLIVGKYDADLLSHDQFVLGEAFYSFFKYSQNTFQVIKVCAQIYEFYENANSENYQLNDDEIDFAKLFSQNGNKSKCFSCKKEFSKKFSKAINYANKLRDLQGQKEKEKKQRKFGFNK